MDAADIKAPGPGDLREWEAEFEAAARRPLATRFRYAFIHTYKPVLDSVSVNGGSARSRRVGWVLWGS